MSDNQGVTPSGPGHSPKGGAAKASPAKPSVPNADEKRRRAITDWWERQSLREFIRLAREKAR